MRARHSVKYILAEKYRRPIYISWDKILLNIDLSSFGGARNHAQHLNWGVGEHESKLKHLCSQRTSNCCSKSIRRLCGMGYYMVVPLNAIWGGFIWFQTKQRQLELPTHYISSQFQSKTTWKTTTKIRIYFKKSYVDFPVKLNVIRRLFFLFLLLYPPSAFSLFPGTWFLPLRICVPNRPIRCSLIFVRQQKHRRKNRRHPITARLLPIYRLGRHFRNTLSYGPKDVYLPTWRNGEVAKENEKKKEKKTSLAGKTKKGIFVCFGYVALSTILPMPSLTRVRLVQPFGTEG